MEKGREKKGGNKFIGVESEHNGLVLMFCWVELELEEFASYSENLTRMNLN